MHHMALGTACKLHLYLRKRIGTAKDGAGPEGPGKAVTECASLRPHSYSSSLTSLRRGCVASRGV